MSRLLKLICSGAVMLTASASIFANTTEVSQSNQSNQSNQSKQTRGKHQPPPFEQGMGLSDTNMPANKYQPAYNAPACIDVKGGWDVDLFGSFIYWHVSQEDMDVAYAPVIVGTQQPSVAYQNFKYKPGFKVGLGLDLNYDGWVSWAEYTWLHQTTSTTQTPPTADPGPARWATNDWFVEPAVDETTLSSSWKMNFDMVDFVFSRPYYEGMKLTVSPYAGMRALWIRQKMNISMLDRVPPALPGDFVSTANRSRCWSLGPVAGVLGHWLLGCGFRFEGNSAVSLLYTRYTKLSHSEYDVQDGIAPVSINASARNISVLRPTAQIGVGLGWGSYFSDTGYYIDISARYDFSYFWGQNMMRQYAVNLNGHVSPAGDLEMHGLTATLRMDF